MSIRSSVIDEFRYELGFEFTQVSNSLTIEEVNALIDLRDKNLEDSTEGTPRFDKLINEIHQLGQIKFYMSI